MDVEAAEKPRFGGWQRTEKSSRPDFGQTGGLGEVIPDLGAALGFATSPSARGRTSKAANLGKGAFGSGQFATKG